MRFLAVGLGVFLTVWGVRAATSRQRPLDLVGALAAGLGVLCAACGATAFVVPRFFD